MESEMTTAEMVEVLRGAASIACDDWPDRFSAIADRLEALESLYAKAWAECEDMREREPIGPSTNPGIISCRKAHDAARKEAGL